MENKIITRPNRKCLLGTIAISIRQILNHNECAEKVLDDIKKLPLPDGKITMAMVQCVISANENICDKCKSKIEEYYWPGQGSATCDDCKKYCPSSYSMCISNGKFIQKILLKNKGR
jgi:hypothetical protein